MSARRHSNLRPVIVEVQPDTATTVPGSAPSSPSNASKTVRFAHTSENGSSRPLTTVEAWSLYNFEVHARSCPTCYHSRATRLCDTGDALGKDVACHVFSRDSEIYAVRTANSSKLVRVEIPHGYSSVRQWLQSVERQQSRSSHKTPRPTSIDYTRVYPITSSTFPRRTPQYPDQNVYIEPAHTSSRRSSKPHHNNHRYSSTVVANGDNNVENVAILPVLLPSSSSSSSPQRRGTLYERDAQRRKDTVKIEVREPEDRSTSTSGRRRHRRHSVWL